MLRKINKVSLFDSGDEAFKAANHGAALVLALQMGVYNSIVYRKRGTGWHLFSAVVYSSLALLEVVQVYRHTGCRKSKVMSRQ